MKQKELEKLESKGITLIALVITIIVLLILAGVSIAMLTGENGILTQAQRAKTETENAAANEAATLDDYNDYLNNVTRKFYTENSTINGEEAGAMNPTIPAGFKPVDENGATWGDGTTAPSTDSVNNGLVIEDGSGNQFVWVPVTTTYERNTSYEYANISEMAHTDTGYLPEGIQPTTDVATNNENAEREAVTSKGGFYISRYEAGKEGTSTLVSKSGATVWNNIPQTDCKTTAKTFINNNNVKSALCSGIQWDMTMAFVNGKQDGTGSTYDVTTYSSSRHAGGSSPVASGQNEVDRVCNIYDLEGNCCEYVAEMSSYSEDSQFVGRGGRYNNTGPASYRVDSYGTVYTSCSFRFVLYVM